MNFDFSRNSAYWRAIQSCVKPGDQVVDLGAGLGMLGFLAVNAGAGAVHLIEPHSSIEIAKQVAQENKFTNCRFHKTVAEDVSLEKPANVIISVFTGNFLLEEDLLPTLFKARDRFLAPSGKLIPDRGKMLVQPVTCEDYYRSLIRYLDKDTFGIDYQVLGQYLLNSAYYDHFNDIDFEPLGEPATLMELDFTTATSTALDEEADVTISGNGHLHGWLGWSDIRLDDSWFSTSPTQEKTHWRQVFFPLPEPVPVKPGDRLHVRFRRPPFGDWTWITRHGDNRWKQSTFFSRPPDLDGLAKLRDDFRPSLNSRGEATRLALELFTGDKPVPEIARQLTRRYPDEFADEAEAAGWVQKLVRSYSL